MSKPDNQQPNKDDFLKKINIYLNEMDFESQKKAERLYQAIILIVAIVSFLVGYQQEKFSICVYSILSASVVSVILIAPAWPWWKTHKLVWQKPQYTS